MKYSEMIKLLNDILCTFNTNHPSVNIYYDNDVRRRQFVLHAKVGIDHKYAYTLSYEQVENISNLYDYCLAMHSILGTP